MGRLIRQIKAFSVSRDSNNSLNFSKNYPRFEKTQFEVFESMSFFEQTERASRLITEGYAIRLYSNFRE